MRRTARCADAAPVARRGRPARDAGRPAHRRAGAGTGPGPGAREVGLVEAALQARRATVLDADALTILARDAALRDCLHDRCVLTPHGGEFARLFRMRRRSCGRTRTRRPRCLARRCRAGGGAAGGCVVLLKGADSVIAAPDRAGGGKRCGARPGHALACDGGIGRCVGRADRRTSRARSVALRGGRDGGLAACRGGARLWPRVIADDLPDAMPGLFRRMGL